MRAKWARLGKAMFARRISEGNRVLHHLIELNQLRQTNARFITFHLTNMRASGIIDARLNCSQGRL